MENSNLFTQVQKRRQELIRKGYQPSTFVMITNSLTMLNILKDAMQNEKQVKDYKRTKTFYGMNVVIIKSDKFDHNRQIHFEIFEQINSDLRD